MWHYFCGYSRVPAVSYVYMECIYLFTSPREMMEIEQKHLIKTCVVARKIAINGGFNCTNGSCVCKQCKLISFWKFAVLKCQRFYLSYAILSLGIKSTKESSKSASECWSAKGIIHCASYYLCRRFALRASLAKNT